MVMLRGSKEFSLLSGLRHDIAKLHNIQITLLQVGGNIQLIQDVEYPKYETGKFKLDLTF